MCHVNGLWNNKQKTEKAQPTVEWKPNHNWFWYTAIKDAI